MQKWELAGFVKEGANHSNLMVCKAHEQVNYVYQKLSDRLGSVHTKPCMRVSENFGGNTLLHMDSKKLSICVKHIRMIWAVENTNLRDQVDYIGSSPEEINKGLNQSNRNENER